MLKLLPICLIILLYSCSPAVKVNLTEQKRPTLKATEDINVLLEKDSVPVGALKLGEITVKDGGLTANCGYNVMLNKAVDAAKSAGANLLKIDKHILPNLLGSSCHQFETSIYILNDSLNLSKSIATEGIVYKNQISSEDFSKWRIGINGGLSYLLAKISNEVPLDSRNYIKGLKSGYHFSADAGYFWKEGVGLGVKYSNFKSSNQDEMILRDNGMVVYAGSVSDNITTQFIGPVYYNRYYTKNRKTVFLTGLSLGYLDYNNKGKLAEEFVIKGGTIGLGFDLGADFSIGKNLSLGFGLAYVAGTLKKLQRRDGSFTQTINLEKGNYESMSRLDLSAGLRYTL